MKGGQEAKRSERNVGKASCYEASKIDYPPPVHAPRHTMAIVWLWLIQGLTHKFLLWDGHAVRKRHQSHPTSMLFPFLENTIAPRLLAILSAQIRAKRTPKVYKRRTPSYLAHILGLSLFCKPFCSQQEAHRKYCYWFGASI